MLVFFLLSQSNLYYQVLGFGLNKQSHVASFFGWCPKPFNWYQSHTLSLVVCMGDVQRCKIPQWHKGAMGLITQMAQKDAIDPCEDNIGLSRNLTVMILCNGRAASHMV